MDKLYKDITVYS